MTKISTSLLQELRRRTGLGMMDCKKALEESGGDIDKAIDILRKKGASVAAKRASKETSAGLVHAYIHPGAKLGVLVEIDCETDFVAQTEDLKNFAQDLCLHIAALKPLYLKPEKIDPVFLEHEISILKDKLQDSGKSESILNNIVEGKLNKLYSEICLLQQSFVKDDQKTVEDVVKELMAKTGERIEIARFSRYEIGA